MIYPNGVYIAMNLTRDSENAIRDYIESNLKDIKKNDDLHSTVAYSKKPHNKMIKRVQDKMHAECKGFAKYGESLVIELESDDLQKHHKMRTEESELVSDYDDYKPHVTISYEGKDIDISKLPPITFDIDLEHEFIENIDEEYNSEEDNDLFNYVAVG